MEQPISNLSALVRKRFSANPGATAITAWEVGKQQWSQWTWEELGLAVRCIAAGLLSTGLKKGSRFIFLAEPCMESIVFDLAVQCLGGVVVSLHENSPAETVKAVLKKTEGAYAFAQDQERWELLLDMMYHVPRLHRVVTAAPVRGDSDIQISFEELKERGFQGLKRTGMLGAGAVEGDLLEHAAKGIEGSRDSLVMFSQNDQCPLSFSHHHLVNKINFWGEHLKPHLEKTARVAVDTSLSDPITRVALLCHLAFGFELIVGGSSTPHASIFPKSNPQALFTNDVRLEQMRLGLISNFREVKGVKKFLLDKSLEILGSEAVLQGGVRSFFADKVVDTKISESLGKELTTVFCASRGLAPQVLRFFKSLNTQIFESYSLPETLGCLTLSSGDPAQWGTLGKPIGNLKLRLTTDQEVIVAGENLPVGYGLCAAEIDLKSSENEVSFFGQEFKTGDLGTLDTEGNFILLGSQRARILLQENKMVFPEKIEAFFRQDPLFDFVLVYGEGKPHLTALFQLNQKAVVEEFSEFKDVFNDPLWHESSELREKIRLRVHELNQDLVFFEMIQNFSLVQTPWTLSGEELTVFGRINRNKIIEKNQILLASLYEPRL